MDQIGVLQAADVFLSHCGMNSANESLYYGVPLVLFPQTSEQGGVARRVSQLGAGRYLRENSPAAIREAVEAVLHEPAYRESAAAISRSFHLCGGPKAAADTIERVAGK